MIALLVAVSTNIASVIFLQIQMIQAIVQMRGYDIKDNQVKILVFVILTG